MSTATPTPALDILATVTAAYEALTPLSSPTPILSDCSPAIKTRNDGELEQLVVSQGFKVLAVSTGYEGDTPMPNSEQLVYILGLDA